MVFSFEHTRGEPTTVGSSGFCSKSSWGGGGGGGGGSQVFLILDANLERLSSEA